MKDKPWLTSNPQQMPKSPVLKKKRKNDLAVELTIDYFDNVFSPVAVSDFTGPFKAAYIRGSQDFLKHGNKGKRNPYIGHKHDLAAAWEAGFMDKKYSQLKLCKSK